MPKAGEEVGEEVWFLENHSHTLSKLGYFHIFIDILPVKGKIACYLTALYEVVHTVEGVKKSGFSAA